MEHPRFEVYWTSQVFVVVLNSCQLAFQLPLSRYRHQTEHRYLPRGRGYSQLACSLLRRKDSLEIQLGQLHLEHPHF